MRKDFRKILSAVTCCAVLAACSGAKEPEVTRVNFTGYHNDITGKLSDGTEFTGKGWFSPDEKRGDFCIQAANVVCSGTYSAGTELCISGRLECSDGTTGTYQSERINSGSFVKPVIATGEMPDGRTAIATFSAIKSGSMETTCLR